MYLCAIVKGITYKNAEIFISRVQDLVKYGTRASFVVLTKLLLRRDVHTLRLDEAFGTNDCNVKMGQKWDKN